MSGPDFNRFGYSVTNPLGTTYEELTRQQTVERADWEKQKGVLMSKLAAANIKESEARSKLERMEAVVNTPELVDFPKAVLLESQHQELRWGTEDREGKGPKEWFWLISHLMSRAFTHHTEYLRLYALAQRDGNLDSEMLGAAMQHHKEKALHHTITSSAALSHWHASMLGKATSMRPSAPAPESDHG